MPLIPDCLSSWYGAELILAGTKNAETPRSTIHRETGEVTSTPSPPPRQTERAHSRAAGHQTKEPPH
jgi:hypothetical protein